MTTPSHDIPALADAIDPRRYGHGDKELMTVPCDELIAASDALRSCTTAMEIGRGIGREEAAKVCDAMAEKMNAQYTNLIAEGHVDRITPVIKEYAATALATAIRALTPAVDVQGLTERIARALKETVKLKWIMNDSGIGEPELEKVIITEENITLCARAVLSALGLEMAKE